MNWNLIAFLAAILGGLICFEVSRRIVALSRRIDNLARKHNEVLEILLQSRLKATERNASIEKINERVLKMLDEQVKSEAAIFQRIGIVESALKTQAPAGNRKPDMGGSSRPWSVVKAEATAAEFTNDGKIV